IRFGAFGELRRLLTCEFSGVSKWTCRPAIFVYAVALGVVHMALHSRLRANTRRGDDTGFNRDALLSATGVDPNASCTP
ncbi:MAG: hypothetical protein G3W65_21960, partial [Xanthomonas perforans]|nr:hypothetical protein [Xanthomonas perforans]